jgi:hypothetical protein
MPQPRRDPCELEIDLFCNGARIDPSATLDEDARHVARTRAGLGSGLEIVIPGPLKEIWMNVPVEEDFARTSPYVIAKDARGYHVRDERADHRYLIRIPEEPAWYDRLTARGVPMGKVGVLQGTYLGIYIANSCLFWYSTPPMNCRFCTTGANVGVNEVARKDVDDVVEVARAAKEESGVTFVHLNSGHQAGRDLALAAPYVRALKEEVGTLVGVQLMPSKDLSEYDRLIDLGADHFSFCYEFQNPEYFERYLPGKHRWFGQQVFFDALEYVSKRLGKGAVSGEIIAGVEPVEDTIRAIDYITSVGAFPTVCVFRPVVGADMEPHLPPRYEEMVAVFAHVYEACRKNAIPIGAAPNIEVSLIVQPDDTRYLATPGPATWGYEAYLRLARAAARPLFAKKMRPTAARAGGPHLRSIGGLGVAPPAAPPAMTAAAASEPSADVRDLETRTAYATVRFVAESAPGAFTVEEQGSALEIAPSDPLAAAPSRCRLKIFRPRENKDRLCAFFYKRSNLSWSRDRFSYGAVEFHPDRLSADVVEGWLSWLRDGFVPDRRPAHLKRAFLYTIPD